MCGRLVCLLEGPNLSVRCEYRSKEGVMERPEWEGAFHTPSYNIPPTTQVPVLYGRMGKRFLRSMRWGLVPSSHKKPLREFTLSTHNCCSETIMERPIYSRVFKQGRRCIIPAAGFYEWSSQKGAEKIPHFVHPTEEGKMMFIAGLYDRCKLEADGSELYSASVITTSASQSINWLHHRMPALLETEEEIQRWLHSGQLQSESLFSLLHPKTCISLYPVCKTINIVTTNGPDCLTRKEPTKKRKSVTLEKFFTKRPKLEDVKKEELEDAIPSKEDFEVTKVDTKEGLDEAIPKAEKLSQ